MAHRKIRKKVDLCYKCVYVGGVGASKGQCSVRTEKQMHLILSNCDRDQTGVKDTGT